MISSWIILSVTTLFPNKMTFWGHWVSGFQHIHFWGYTAELWLWTHFLAYMSRNLSAVDSKAWVSRLVRKHLGSGLKPRSINGVKAERGLCFEKGNYRIGKPTSYMESTKHWGLGSLSRWHSTIDKLPSAAGSRGGFADGAPGLENRTKECTL